MSHPFEPLTTKKLKVFLNKYLEENCKSPETNRNAEKASQVETRNKLILVRRILKTYRQRQFES